MLYYCRVIAIGLEEMVTLLRDQIALVREFKTDLIHIAFSEALRAKYFPVRLTYLSVVA